MSVANPPSVLPPGASEQARLAPEDFDATWYVWKYPDIAEAVKNGSLKSPLEHYLRHGRQEGRLATPSFEPEWYAMAYPLAVEEVGSTVPADLEAHYRTFGRHRGYLPHPLAKRPTDAAAIASRFGGLWIDHANARDLIRGKYELGLITQQEMHLLETFATQGYVVLERAVPPVVLDRAEAALEGAYDGKYKELRFECHALSKERMEWDDRLKQYAAKALDMHWFLSEIREAAFAPAVARFLHLIFERPALASQSLGFYRGSGQEMHQDSAYVAYTLPQHFAAAWIALEDVAVGAGELQYFPESHRRLPEYLYNSEYKNVSDAERAGADTAQTNAEVKAHVDSIEAEAARLGLKREFFHAKRGDVLIWHSDLAHGGRPISNKRSRKSLVFHYSPREVPPLYAERMRTSIRRHQHGCFYTSGIYEFKQ